MGGRDWDSAMDMQIRDGQKLALIKLCQRFTKSRHCRLWMLSKLLNKEVNSTDELYLSDWRQIRNQAYPNWPNDDWTISEEFMAEGWRLERAYEKEVLGQQDLF